MTAFGGCSVRAAVRGSRRAGLWAFVLASLWWSFGAPAAAQPERESTSSATAAAGSSDRSPFVPEGFEPVRGRPVDPINPNPLVVLSYAAVLAGLFGYVIHMVRGQAELGKRLDELRRRLRDLES